MSRAEQLKEQEAQRERLAQLQGKGQKGSTAEGAGGSVRETGTVAG